MKKIVLYTSVLIIIALLLSVWYFKDGLKPNPENVRVKDIKLATKVDTVNYALGNVWAKNIGKYVGIKSITYSFYTGAWDYMRRDSGKMGIYKANIYLQNHLAEIQKDSIWPVEDEDIKLSRIHMVSKQDSFSYALGFAWCAGAYGIGITKISPALLQGLLKGLKGDTSLFRDYNAADNYLMAYVEELRMKKYGKIRKMNEDWLKENASKEGVVVLPDGVQYKIMKSGHGISATENDILECHYIGKLIDGRVFDNAYQEGPTFRFYLSSVIIGWGEALKLMREGDEWIIYIPYQLAYGSGGMGDLVPPYATILIDVELVKVNRGPK